MTLRTNMNPVQSPCVREASQELSALPPRKPVYFKPETGKTKAFGVAIWIASSPVDSKIMMHPCGDSPPFRATRLTESFDANVTSLTPKP